MEIKKQRFQLFLVLLALCSIALLYYLKHGENEDYFLKCPFHALTGWLCPGCGSQRALSALLKGKLIEAIRFNILLVAGFFMMIVYTITILLSLFTSKKAVLNIFGSAIFLRLIVTTVIIFFIARNIPADPFNLLEP